MQHYLLFSSSLYFLALINPASKIFILSSMEPPLERKELLSIALRASLVALFILVACACLGAFVLHEVFHVQVYSLQVAGGIVLFTVGLNAVRRGNFLEENGTKKYHSDISIVPMAAPLIAGPGTITGAISFSSAHGEVLTVLCLAAAVALNFVLMLLSGRIGRFLARYAITGPLIRLTGLIVASVAVQMVFSGSGVWLTEVLEHAATGR